MIRHANATNRSDRMCPGPVTNPLVPVGVPLGRETSTDSMRRTVRDDTVGPFPTYCHRSTQQHYLICISILHIGLTENHTNIFRGNSWYFEPLRGLGSCSWHGVTAHSGTNPPRSEAIFPQSGNRALNLYSFSVILQCRYRVSYRPTPYRAVVWYPWPGHLVSPTAHFGDPSLRNSIQCGGRSSVLLRTNPDT